MREKWEELLNDPLMLDLKAILQAGYFEFTVSHLTVLPRLYGADVNAIREALLQALMADDPGKDYTDPDLGQTTQVNLAIFRVTSNTRVKTRKGAQEVAGALYRPDRPVKADAVRRRPTKSQKKGGIEWQVKATVRERLIADALGAGVELPDGLVDSASAHPLPTRPSQHQSQDGDLLFRYKPLEREELEKDLFERESTQRFIEAFRHLKSVTIYAGAGVAADEGAPLGDSLMHQLLAEYVKEHPSMQHIQGDGYDNPKDSEIETQRRREAVATRITEAIQSAYPPGYIGSIVRQSALSDPGRSRRDPEPKLIERIRSAIDRGQKTGGFLARSVGAVAFALLSKGREARIITTNYDESLTEQQGSIIEYFEEFFSGRNLGFDVLHPSRTTSPSGAKVPLAHVNGIGPHEGKRIPDPPVVGEAQFFIADGDSKSKYQQWRESLVGDALETSTCLFVGTSLTDPDVVGALAKTIRQGHRFAIVLAPDREAMPDGSVRVSVPHGRRQAEAEERAIVRDLVCQRFLHLGVEPIMVDRPYQVPQLLTELALATVANDYRAYTERSKEWWNNVEEEFGYKGPLAGERTYETQQKWQKELVKLRDQMYDSLKLAKSTELEGERLKVEVWVRHPEANKLFLWATSESQWLFGDTAHTCDIEGRDSHYAVQETYWKGHRWDSELIPPRGQFSYHLSVPLTLHEKPWYHLPVGVVSVLSSKGEGGKLFEACQNVELLDSLETTLQREINNLLDPESRDSDN